MSSRLKEGQDMEYCVISKGRGEGGMADKVVDNMLTGYSRHLYGFTRNEFDSIVKYDLLNIMAFHYSKMNALQKSVICDSISKVMGLYDMEDVMDHLAYFEEYCRTHRKTKKHFYGILLNYRIRWSVSRKTGKGYSWNVIFPAKRIQS